MARIAAPPSNISGELAGSPRATSAQFRPPAKDLALSMPLNRSHASGQTAMRDAIAITSPSSGSVCKACRQRAERHDFSPDSMRQRSASKVSPLNEQPLLLRGVEPRFHVRGRKSPTRPSIPLPDRWALLGKHTSPAPRQCWVSSTAVRKTRCHCFELLRESAK